MSPLDHIPGLRYFEPRDPHPSKGYPYVFTEDAGLSTAQAVVSSLNEGWGLSFFDGAHPEFSDPGAYISFIRANSRIMAMAGNHGWTTGWIRLSEKTAALYLASCIPYNRDDRAGSASNLWLDLNGSPLWPGHRGFGMGFRVHVLWRSLGNVRPGEGTGPKGKLNEASIQSDLRLLVALGLVALNFILRRVLSIWLPDLPAAGVSLWITGIVLLSAIAVRRKEEGFDRWGRWSLVWTAGLALFFLLSKVSDYFGWTQP